MIFKLFLVFLVVSLAICDQSVPIPSQLDGLTRGQLNSSFVLEAHYDLLCPDSRASYFALKQVLDQANATNANLLLRVHFFPLPYHTYSHRTAIGERFIQDKYGKDLAWKFVDQLFSTQETFYNGNINNLSIESIDEKLSSFADQAVGIEKNTFLNGLRNGVYDGEVRISWKLGCQRGVSGTPFYYANGVKVDDAPGFNVVAWNQFFKDQNVF